MSYYLEVRYEELLAHPTDVLREVCAFCGLEYNPAMLTYFMRAPQRLKEHKARVRMDGATLVTHEQRLEQQRLTMSPPDVSRSYAWKRIMSPTERRQFERVAGKLLTALGYEVEKA